MIETRCAICGANQRIKELYKANFDLTKIDEKVFSARRLPDRIHYRIVKCERCSLVFSNPILEPGEIHSLYFKSDFNYRAESKYLKKTYGYYLKKMLPKKNLGKIKLLDIGCGNGFFLEETLRMGVRDVWGIEPGKSSVEKASRDLQKRIKVDILRTGIFKNGNFDVICCFHTLDHVVQPNEFLKIIYKLLKKGGRAFIIVHNTMGLSVKLLGEKSPIFDIEHVYLFNKNTLRKMFRKNGFKNIKVFDVENAYPLNYWLRMTPVPKEVKSFLIQFLYKTGLGNASIKMKAGNIGITAVRT